MDSISPNTSWIPFIFQVCIPNTAFYSAELNATSTYPAWKITLVCRAQTHILYNIQFPLVSFWKGHTKQEYCVVHANVKENMLHKFLFHTRHFPNCGADFNQPQRFHKLSSRGLTSVKNEMDFSFPLLPCWSCSLSHYLLLGWKEMMTLTPHEVDSLTWILTKQYPKFMLHNCPGQNLMLSFKQGRKTYFYICKTNLLRHKKKKPDCCSTFMRECNLGNLLAASARYTREKY